ncbi:purine-binding chemotaxis protein CheW [Leptospira wolffii]|uniref:Chemotaxis protein CheW n=1 Tax=Leptospira wolffii TaxID=409998 RepID=A0A2M9Z845_9LEPT|nr:chemotaxis protein CheW [Leptospira wolffii]PJZ64590.1 chemotaxis protein CheW [Leptospira wolffii]TGK55164.1 purine-binding chemotaxis protein CheW [Leptospira wolffii]TGK70535.1 purine-binding chemotaxis protein CheW [Leptospira wolffii]TGK77617.1 purine-binding chemotaxis protein CheW [Leptospira wolffii]TGL29928.1 purine-binding chemotaxis protein CheW [Leptospira wolffii]
MKTVDKNNPAEEDQTGKEVESLKEFLTFEVDKEVFGIDILHIHEILKPVPITRIPNVEPYILGVINLRGEIIPIMDLKELFGLGFCDILPSTRIIVVVYGEKRGGLLVDSVKQVVKIHKDKVNQADEELSVNYSELIESVSQFEDSLILNLNLSMLMEYAGEES